MLEVVLNVRVRLRDHLLEAGVDWQLECAPAEEQGQQRTEQDDHAAMVEHHTLQPVPTCPVELPQIRDDRHVECV
ncbi:hypothetical protein D3C78_1883400 [compost metagenome]